MFARMASENKKDAAETEKKSDAQPVEDQGEAKAT